MVVEFPNIIILISQASRRAACSHCASLCWLVGGLVWLAGCSVLLELHGGRRCHLCARESLFLHKLSFSNAIVPSQWMILDLKAFIYTVFFYIMSYCIVIISLFYHCRNVCPISALCLHPYIANRYLIPKWGLYIVLEILKPHFKRGYPWQCSFT